MKRIGQKIIFCILSVLVCVSLSGCTIGEYYICEFYTDESGNQRFMLVGERGANGGEEKLESESFEIADNMRESENSDEAGDIQENENSEKADAIQENNYDSKSIVGTSLKRGWTSSDNSILKGRGVSVKEDSTLFSIVLGQDKKVRISYDIALDDGEYQLVYTNSDGAEQILQDGKIIQSEEQILFTQGQNTIAILSNDAVFKEIDIRIIGIEVSDFGARTENTIGNGLQEMENKLPDIGPVVEDNWPDSIGREDKNTTAENLSFEIQITNPMVLAITCVTESGKLDMEIKSDDGKMIFSESDIQTENFEVNINSSGTYKIIIQAEKHTGSFWIEPQNDLM